MTLSEIPVQKLKTGGEMPIIGFGTWDLGDDLRKSVKSALDAGYTFIDTAEGYRNEAEIGEVLQDYAREELFLSSKVLPSNLNYGNVLEACHRTLDKLGTSYLDLYLIHWPNPAISLRETLLAFKKLYESDRVKNIGVSNFNKYQLKVAERISEVPISVNQVEFQPWYHDEDLLNYCIDQDIVLTAAAPLARTAVLGDDLIQKLSDKYDRSPAQIVLRWEMQKEVITIPRSSSEEHIKENFHALDFELESPDVERIDNIPKEQRTEKYVIDFDDEYFGIPA